MTRHDTDTLDPREQAELDALEAALAGEPTADPQWAALVAAVRDEPPAPGDQATRALDEAVAAGFPRRRPGWLRVPTARRMLPALAVCSTLAVGGIVVGSGALDTGTDEAATSVAPSAGDARIERGQTSRAAAESAPAPADSTEAFVPGTRSSGSASSVAPSVGTAGGVTPPGDGSPASDAVPSAQRSVERSATLELATGADKLQEASDRIVRATQDLGGIVERSSVDSGRSGGNATFVLRVPTGRLDDALKRYGEIASVTRLSEGAEDITREVVSARDRLADARAERKALLRALSTAKTEGGIASLKRRIAANRSAIALEKGRVRALGTRADRARVDVFLRARGSSASADDGGAWGPGAAADTALRVLEIAAGVLLVALAVIGPLALLAGVVVLLGRGLRRRRREAALGTA